MGEIKREKNLIEFLGFTLSEPDIFKNYKIYDKNGEQVGFIKFNKDGNPEDDFHNKYKYEYYTQINTPDLFVKSGATSPTYPSFPLVFYIKYKKYGTNIYLNMNENFMAIRMHYFHTKPDNKVLYFYLKPNGFHFDYHEPSNYYFDEGVNVDLNENFYSYYLAFVNTNDSKHNYPLYNGQLKCQTIDTNLLKIENTWNFWRGKEEKNHKPNYISTVEASLEDTINKHKMGIDAFYRMRYLLNVPFDKDIILFLLQNTEFTLPQYLDKFIPEIEESMEKNIVKRKNYK